MENFCCVNECLIVESCFNQIACIKHFSVEPLSFLGLGILDEICEVKLLPVDYLNLLILFLLILHFFDLFQ